MSLFNQSGSFYGAPLPRLITTATYLPLGYADNTGTVTTTANRCYYVYWPISESRTFAGVNAYNQGAGDSGEKFRIMFFNDDGSSGGPGTLAKDFGEVTLGAASAYQTLTSSWAASAGRYWGAIWHDSATSMYGMSPFPAATAVGSALGINNYSVIGSINDSGTNWGANAMPVAHYVDTAYGAAPSTAVAPTATLRVAFASVTPLVPAFRLRA
jgi:hypothetical protein